MEGKRTNGWDAIGLLGDASYLPAFGSLKLIFERQRYRYFPSFPQSLPSLTPPIETSPMSSVESSFTTFTSLPPSCVLFFPQDERRVVVGTYLLNEDAGLTEGRKTGSLLLYKMDEGGQLYHSPHLPTFLPSF